MRFFPLLLALFSFLFASRAAAATPASAQGARLLERKGCVACHSLDGTPRVGPTLSGLWGSRRSVVTAGVRRDVLVDEAYVARSLREPEADVVDGYPSKTMPRFDLSDSDLEDLNAALRELSTPAARAPLPARTPLAALAAAAAAFVGLHLFMSSQPVRRRLVGVLGSAFTPVYSIVVLCAFALMIVSFRAAPYVEVWAPPSWARWIPLLTMPIAVFLQVCGFSTRGPTTVMQGERAKDDAATRGIFAITRHPANWGFALWAAAHLTANGELRAVLVFAAILSLAILGMLHIDRRRARDLGDAWTSYAQRTSIIPFAAMAKGRARLRFSDVGATRIIVAALIYVGLLHAHALVIGASPFP